MSGASFLLIKVGLEDGEGVGVATVRGAAQALFGVGLGLDLYAAS